MKRNLTINKAINKTKIFLAFLYSCVIILALFKVTISNIFATGGIDLDSMQTKTVAFQKENLILSQKIYAESSLFTIASEAAAMGFVQEKNSVYIPAALPIALKQ